MAFGSWLIDKYPDMLALDNQTPNSWWAQISWMQRKLRYGWCHNTYEWYRMTTVADLLEPAAIFHQIETEKLRCLDYSQKQLLYWP